MLLSEVFRTLGDDTRLRILNLLDGRELCVCQIIEALRITQPNASKHLNRMRYAGIIACRKISQWCFYRMNERFISENGLLLNYLAYKWESGLEFAEDLKRLGGLTDNKDCCRRELMHYKP